MPEHDRNHPPGGGAGGPSGDSRREFLKSGTAAAIGGAALLAELGTSAEAAPPQPTRWDRDVDVGLAYPELKTAIDDMMRLLRG